MLLFPIRKLENHILPKDRSLGYMLTLYYHYSQCGSKTLKSLTHWFGTCTGIAFTFQRDSQSVETKNRLSATSQNRKVSITALVLWISYWYSYSGTSIYQGK